MARFNLIQNTFRSGEISPKNYSRTDLQLYYQGCEVLENLLPRTQGGVSRRVGTKFFIETNVEVEDVTNLEVPRLFNFTSTEGIRYILSLGRGSTLTKNEAFDFTNNGYSSINFNSPSNPFFYVVKMSEVQKVQKDDFMFMVHDRMVPTRVVKLPSVSLYGFEVTRINDLSFNIVEPPLYFRVPYRDANASPITFTPSATTGTWSGIGTGISVTASDDFFHNSMVGSPEGMSTIFKITHGSTHGYFIVQEYVSSTVVRGSVLRTLGGTGATTNWAESAWSEYRGYPRTVTIFEERIYYGGSRSEPMRLWGSALGNVFKMHEDVAPSTVEEAAAMPYSFVLSAEEGTEIQWMTFKDELTIGTSVGELTTTGRDTDVALGPNNFKSKEHTKIGSNYIQPVKYDNIFLFLERGGDKIREFTYDLRESSYRTIPLNYLVDPLLTRTYKEYSGGTAFVDKPEVSQWCVQKNYGVIWVIDNYGKLLSLTRDRTLDIVAFAYHTIGGEDTDSPYIHSICTVDDGKYDYLVMLVERTLNGVKKFFIETIGQEFVLEDFDYLGDEEFNSLRYLDCSYVIRENVATDSFEIPIPGIAECEVHVVADGIYLGKKTLGINPYGGDPQDDPLHGLLELDKEYNNICVGFNYIPKLVTVPVEAGSQIGSAQGRIKRLDEVSIKFFKTVGCKYGTSWDKMTELIFRDPNAPIGAPIQPFSGDKIRKIESNYTQEKLQVYLMQEQPLPLYICSITMRGLQID